MRMASKHYGCPACAATVHRGDHSCTKCGYDLTVPAVSPASVAGLPAPLTPTVPASLEARRYALQYAIHSQLPFAPRIESQTDTAAVLVFGRRPNHVLHFLIGLFTFGAWWLIWLLLSVTQREQRRMIDVDEYGRVSSRDF